MKRIAVFGSTGSIGTQTLDVIESNPDKYCVSVLTCRNRVEQLVEQARKFRPEIIVTGTKESAALVADELPGMTVLWGNNGLVEAAKSDYDLMLNSLLGISGMVPTYHAIMTGHNIALANKETLVAGGQIIMDAAATNGVDILPVDSEHSAIFQCLQTGTNQRINRILLTASGGPFRGMNRQQLKEVTLEQALKHPSWSMGRKITIDSATMMNKGFEIIEAKWLFGLEASDIQVLVHPQSIVHSMVEFMDHSIIAQMGLPDMRVPISYAMEYPNRLDNDYDELDFFTQASQLTFQKPDMGTFKCMKLAYQCLDAGGTYTAALNGANEILVDAFLNRRIEFTDIGDMLEQIIDTHKSVIKPTLEDIIETDRAVRQEALSLITGK